VGGVKAYSLGFGFFACPTLTRRHFPKSDFAVMIRGDRVVALWVADGQF
jgi:hypothetical protein